MQFGGVIYRLADKATRFIANCNQKKFHTFLQDVTGFMVGSKSEHSGIIKDGANGKAVSNGGTEIYSNNRKFIWGRKLCYVW